MKTANSWTRLFRLVILPRSSTGEANGWLLHTIMKPIELKPRNPMNVEIAGYAAHSNLTAEDLGVLFKMAAISKGLVNSREVFEEICEKNESSLRRLTDMGVVKIKPEVDHATKTIGIRVYVDLNPRLIEAVGIDFDLYDKFVEGCKKQQQGANEQHITENPADHAG